MKLQELLSTIETIKKGSYCHIEYASYPKPNAANKDKVITKLVKATIRIGVDYSNLEVIKEMRKEKIFDETMDYNKLPYGEWFMPHYIIKHNGDYQLRITRTNGVNHYASVKYLVNGQEIDKEQLRALEIMQPSYWNSKDTMVYNVKIENIVSLG